MDIMNYAKRIMKKIRIELIKIRYEYKYKSDECKIKYLFFPNKRSDELLIVFSAFPSKNRSATYQYVNSFKYLDVNKLYIMDNFGPNKSGGSYYLAHNKDFYIEKAVSQLIENVINKLGIDKRNVITAGTSKGGFAALYFAFKYELGNVVAGAPQTLLGNYLSERKKSCFEYIAGNINESNINYLNSLLYDAVNNSNNKPNVFLHVGKGEHHYSEHVIPFCEHLNDKQIPYELDVQDYNSHSVVGKYYPTFASKCINTIISQ